MTALLDILLLGIPLVDAIQLDSDSEFKAPFERLEELIVRHTRNWALVVILHYVRILSVEKGTILRIYTFYT